MLNYDELNIIFETQNEKMKISFIHPNLRIKNIEVFNVLLFLFLDKLDSSGQINYRIVR